MRFEEFSEGTWDSPASDITRAAPRLGQGSIGGARTLGDIRSQERTSSSGGGVNDVLGNILSGAGVSVPGAASTDSAATTTDPGAANNPGRAGNVQFRSSALTTLNGQQSRMTSPSAGRQMQQDTIPRAQRMASFFGGTITVNDAIAKSGTSRESQTQGSQHFQGRALDISTAGMTDQQKLRLFAAAQRAGFTGFGFGSNILHVDTGTRRHWAYGNSTYGGRRVADLGAAVRSGRAVA
jgi:hypothetical protein